MASFSRSSQLSGGQPPSSILFGVDIDTLDNPGWSVKIDLEDTLLENKSFTQIEKDETDQSWLRCRVEDKKFFGCGDPDRLGEILSIFLSWVKTESDWLTVHHESSVEAELRHDREFWSALGDEVELAQCSYPGCDRRRIQHSVFCRSHHFEMMRSKPAPADD
ncbi:immunity 53 family protein [Romeria aff. gracilis LEGE 07310]|uniref:Immunity 53 family protein n=1 Tax=Vasconcelosia minhoensis LEGE 07310 TaxID=915328 RepID=A0A8J7DKB6_9CYAN|nr:immunity 53 family protein [Romeria gracilis]MBE9076191.1 immunity 53 family protein [Romeria aff. gracilis LEGE 07310]